MGWKEKVPGKAKTTLKPAARSTGANQPSLPYSSTSIRPAPTGKALLHASAPNDCLYI